MNALTNYVAVLRCQTWHVWPSRTVIDPCSINLSVANGEAIPAQLAILSYENRATPNSYSVETTNLGPLAWDGTVPGLYVVRDEILKAPEDVLEVAIPLRHSGKGEIDICINFKHSGKPTSALLESVRATQFATLSVLNLKLGDVLTPAIPPHVREVEESKASSEVGVQVTVRARKSLAKGEIESIVRGIATILKEPQRFEKLRAALELYAAHFTERQVRVRFLLLMLAMEALTETTKKDIAAIELLAKWQSELQAEINMHSRDSEAAASLSALAKELDFRSGDSIGSKIRKLTLRIPTETQEESKELGRIATRLYNHRSTLVHRGYIPNEDIAKIEQEACALLERLLMSYLGHEKVS
jgi:hypothetical protein